MTRCACGASTTLPRRQSVDDGADRVNTLGIPMSTCLICCAQLPERGLPAIDRLHPTAGTFVVVSCPSCGAGRTLPPASTTELVAFYPSSYGPFEATPGRVFRSISAAIQWLQGRIASSTPPLSSVAKLTPGSGLDVGCGRGDLASWLVQRGWKMTGVEPSASAAAIARSRGVNVLEGVLATVALTEGGFDAAILQQSLEHTEEPAADLARIYKAMRPGAIICISVPNFGSWQARRFGSRWFHLDAPRHRSHFTQPSLTRALQEAGFISIETTTSTSPAGLPGSIQYRIFGRCLYPSGLPLRVAGGLCVLALPIARLLDRAFGGGDILHAVAVKPNSA